VSCACELILLLSGVLLIVTDVHKFQVRLVINGTPSKWRPMASDRCSDKDVFLRALFVFPAVLDRREGTVTTLSRAKQGSTNFQFNTSTKSWIHNVSCVCCVCLCEKLLHICPWLGPLETARQLWRFLEHKDAMDVNLCDYCYALLQIRRAQEGLVIMISRKRNHLHFLFTEKYPEVGLI
jgi:hypothetical protein